MIKNKILLTIIIPTLNNIGGLSYLLNYFKNKPYKVVVIDNKKKNLGFAGGVNKGAEDVKTKWMLILNDDIEFKIKSEKLKVKNYNSKLKIENEETIQRLINFAEENNLDAVSPILRNPNGEVENLGYKVLPIGRIELAREMDSRLRGNDNGESGNDSKERGNDNKGRGNDNKEQKKILNTKYEILDTDIDGITAACLLVKTEVFKKLGGFDEKFFAYLEDVDFFLRMKKMDSRLRGNDNKGRGDDNGNRGNDKPSFGIAYEIEVLHNHMTTTKTMGNFKARQDMVNWWRLFFKHPDKFKLNLDFIVERLRNISGFIKATFKSI